VSTQLVEAGVDIDFPIVYRALAGLDSIAQAAGRCNREGKLSPQGRLGTVVIFAPPRDAPAGMIRKGIDSTKEMLRLHQEGVARLAPEIFDTYFRLFYARANSFDEKGIMDLLAGADVDEAKIQFRTAAAKFSLIDDGGQCPVIVNFSSKKSVDDPRLSCEALSGHVERFGPDRATLRRLQRYSVNIPRRVFDTLLAAGAIRGIKNMEGLSIQSLPGLYDDTFGLRLEGPEYSALDFIA
jgi:CRISPR-associated endonuclease/helicase Cas3